MVPATQISGNAPKTNSTEHTMGGREGSTITKPIFQLQSKTLTFLLCDEVLDDDVRHAVSVGIAILVEAVNRAENKLVAGDGPILAAQHLDER